MIYIQSFNSSKRSREMKKSVLNSLMSLSLIFLVGGCATVEKLKDIEDPLKSNDNSSTSSTVAEVTTPSKEVNLYFVRPSALLTAAQVVELYIDDKEIGELSNGSNFETKTMPGNYEIATKVGFSLGLQGVCKFSKDFNLTKESYYFKVDYDIGMLCGEYEINEISKDEYGDLSAN
jgi:hypothetical protein